MSLFEIFRPAPEAPKLPESPEKQKFLRRKMEFVRANNAYVPGKTEEHLERLWRDQEQSRQAAAEEAAEKLVPEKVDAVLHGSTKKEQSPPKVHDSEAFGRNMDRQLGIELSAEQVQGENLAAAGRDGLVSRGSHSPYGKGLN